MPISILFRKYLYWTISFISILVILMSIYFQLGGFDKPTYGKAINPYYSIAGKWLKGEVSKKEEGTLFNDIKDLIALKKIKGILCIVDYKNDSLAENEICRFIGVKLENEISAIPSGFEVLEVSAKYSYQAALTMHPLVMPNTRKIEDQLALNAKEYEDVLLPLTMEWYFPDNSVIIQMLSE